MDDIIFKDYIQMVNFFKKCECELGFGIEGCCYKQGNMSYKLYNNAFCYLNNNDVKISELLKFENVMIDNVYFIRCLLFLRENLVGVGAEFAPGEDCSRINLYRKDIDKIVCALDMLRHSIYELSARGIYVSDIDLSNILYNGKVFSLIDTVDYYYSGDKQDDSKGRDSADIIYKKNMKMIMSELFRSITDANMHCDKFIFSYLNDIDCKYKNYLVDIDLLLNPSDTILGIRNTIETNIGREIQTFSNCRKDLVKMKKK